MARTHLLFTQALAQVGDSLPPDADFFLVGAGSGLSSAMHPALEVVRHPRRWTRRGLGPGDDRGHYVSVAFVEPSLAPGSYKLMKSGAEKGYQVTYRKPFKKRDEK